jgi:hypothetical protein
LTQVTSDQRLNRHESSNGIFAVACGVGYGCLAKGECEQARAEQHEARRRQCKETAGNEVLIAHGTPTTLDARPNLLKISESASQKELMRRLA